MQSLANELRASSEAAHARLHAPLLALARAAEAGEGACQQWYSDLLTACATLQGVLQHKTLQHTCAVGERRAQGGRVVADVHATLRGARARAVGAGEAVARAAAAAGAAAAPLPPLAPAAQPYCVLQRVGGGDGTALLDAAWAEALRALDAQEAREGAASAAARAALEREECMTEIKGLVRALRGAGGAGGAGGGGGGGGMTREEAQNTLDYARTLFSSFEEAHCERAEAEFADAPYILGVVKAGIAGAWGERVREAQSAMDEKWRGAQHGVAVAVPPQPPPPPPPGPRPCPKCTFVNPANSVSCEICEFALRR